MVFKDFEPSYGDSHSENEAEPVDDSSETNSEPQREFDDEYSCYKIHPDVGLNIYSQSQFNKVRQEDRYHRKFRAFGSSSPWRFLAAVPEKVFADLAELKKRFSNFSHVIEMIEGELRLACLSATPTIAIMPKLLLGPPGVGKTRFCVELAKILGVPFHQKSLATMTASFVLTGMSDGWADAMPGFISTTLKSCAVANPLVLLDEIDKSLAERRYDPSKPLLSLLEPHSAQKFEDEYFGMEFNASAINWIATANDEEGISEPVLSRLMVFRIEIPDRLQSQAIVKSVYKEMLAEHEWGKHFMKRLSKDVVVYLCELPPRTVRQKLLSACAMAAKRRGEKIRIVLSDFEIDNKHKRKSGIGFLAKY